MAAGALALAYGTDRLSGLAGAATRRPIAVGALALAGVSLAGLPPSAGFAGKFLVLQSSLASGQWWWAVLVLVGGLLTAAYVGRVLRVLFADSEEGTAPDGSALAELRPVPRRMDAAAMVLALLAVAVGLRALEPVRLLVDASPFGGAA
jgi:formate hydrogenlyase subunit 3/multisubunit Na+/H+ antiporter MnhD subunit